MEKWSRRWSSCFPSPACVRCMAPGSFCALHTEYGHHGCHSGKPIKATLLPEAVQISPLIFNWKSLSILCLHMLEADLVSISVGLSSSSFNLPGIQKRDIALNPVLVTREGLKSLNWLYSQNAHVCHFPKTQFVDDVVLIFSYEFT